MLITASRTGIAEGDGEKDSPESEQGCQGLVNALGSHILWIVHFDTPLQSIFH